MSGTPLRVAVLGAGTVGRQVIERLRGAADPASPIHGTPLELAGIGVRDLDAARARGLPADLLTDAPAHLVAAPDTDIVVELMGGDEPARTLIAAALTAGKAVVTANKHVIAHHGAELEGIARRAEAPFRFEAAVGGGIPVLWPLAADVAGNRIERVRGIVNGTTNFILTAMAAGEGTYESVLRDAQQRGYAEADPSGDVEGRDAINKLVILYRLAFGGWIDPSTVIGRPPGLRRSAGPGITGVTAAELEAAHRLGLTLKLVASAGRSAATVVPTAVPVESGLGRTGGVANRIEVTAAGLGTVGFDGPGAGGEATSSAVIADLVAIARGAGSSWASRPAAAATTLDSADGDWSARWFLLLPGVRAGAFPGDLAEATAETDTGLAVRTGWQPSASVRARLTDALPASADAPLYPIDD